MAGRIAFPDCAILVSGCDPNDPNGIDLWTDLAVRTWRVNNAGRGRQYEQDLNRTGAMDADFRNADEWLNPANATSPLLTLAKPMRRIRWMASYPPAGTGNLLNSNAGTAATGPIDPTFESYTAGVLPGWLTPVGATTPTVQAANPHGGTKSLQYTVAGTTVPQGASTVPREFIPGKQYTASWFVRQSSASTQQIAVGGLTALDRFQRTGALSGSTAESGQTWSFTGGVTGDYTTAAGPNPPGNGAALISNSSTNVSRFATLGVSAQDFDVRMRFTVPAVATGQTYVAAITGRFTNAANQYRFELNFNTDGTVDVDVLKLVGGVATQVGATVANIASYTAGTKIWLRAQASGTTLSATAWLDGTVMPQAVTISRVDASLTGAGQVGFVDLLITGNTNGTLVITHGPMAVTSYSTPGTTTTTAAAYVRLSVTFTATQPTHTVQVTTIGTAVAGTVNLDDLQHEPGASANTFTTTGPLIRGVWGGHVMDDEVSWVPGTQGFEGSVSVPCSGPFAALAQIPIHTDVVTATLRKSPLYYWPLWDQQGATSFAEISGNSGPTMRRFDLATAATTFSASTPNNVPGDPSGAGVAIAGQNVSIAGSDLEVPPTSAIILGSSGATWGLSLAFWLTTTDTTDRILFQVANPAGSVPQIGISGPNSNQLQVFYGAGVVATSTPNNYGDGRPHLWVATVSVASNTMTVTLYVDGQQVGVSSSSYTGTFGVAPNFLMNWVMCAGQGFTANTTQITTQAGGNGTYSHLALWNRALSAAEATDLWNAGSGNVGERSGARTARYLNNYYTGPTVIDLASFSTMGPPTAPESTSLLAALQRVTQDTEMGNLFENRDGAVQADGREVRWQRITPTVVFGDGGGSEIPYAESPKYGYGLTQVNNQALITRTGGIRAVARPDTTGSIATNYPRGYTLTVDCQTDAEAQAHADWIPLTRGQPQQRVANLTINLGANPALFPAIMNLEIGTRATVKRRPKAANSGAGITMSQDVFVENIVHRGVDPETGQWLVDVQCSPVPKPQPWICGDATFGVAGTMIPGF